MATVSPAHDMNQHPPPFRIGIDIGSVQVKVVFLEAPSSVVGRACRSSQGRPVENTLAYIRDLVAAHGLDLPVLVGVTGNGGSLVAGECLTQVNEVVAAAAAAVRAAVPDASTVVDVGGPLSKWIRLGPADDAAMVEDFSTNGACAAGSGTFVEQQAKRLGLDTEALGVLAESAAWPACPCLPWPRAFVNASSAPPS